MKIGDITKIVTLVIALGGAAWGIYEVAEGRYASASDFQQLTKRVTISELTDLKNIILKDVYFLRDQQRKYPSDQKITDKLSEVSKEQESIEKQILELKTKGPDE